MPRAVILRFGKAADAEMFCRLLAGKDEYEPGELEHLLLESSAKLAAVVGVPGLTRNSYCTCDIDNVMGTARELKSTGDPRKDARRLRSQQRRRRKSASKSRGGGWVRGNQFGWWLCSRCGKPSKAVATHFITGMLMGANDLLPEILEEGPALTPGARWEAAGGARVDYEAGIPISGGRRQRI